MKRKEYKTVIDAPRERVWESLWGKETYSKWTRAFSPQSRVDTTWEEGAKVLFRDGDRGGMVSRIEEKKKPEKMAFRHLGLIDKDGKEDLESDAVKGWKNTEEIYILKDRDGMTELIVEMDVNEEYEEFMDTSWPKAFKNLKEITEI